MERKPRHRAGFLFAARGLRVIRYDNRDTGFFTKFDDAEVPGIASLLLGSKPHLPLRVPYMLRDMTDPVS